jgi:hypothetical protein
MIVVVIVMMSIYDSALRDVFHPNMAVGRRASRRASTRQPEGRATKGRVA